MINPIVKISDLSFTYPGALSASLHNVSLEVAKGEFLAVIGSNGSGKSTLCKVLNGLIPHFIAGDYTGSVLIDGRDTSELSIAELSHKIGYVYQDFENQIVCPTVLEDASFACLNYALPDYEEKGREALRLTDLSHKENDYIPELPDNMLKQLNFVELNGKDTAFNPESAEAQSRTLGSHLSLPVAAGSDAHQVLQFNCINTELSEDCYTIEKLRRLIESGAYKINISSSCALKVKSAETLKKALKKIHELGGDY